MAGFLNFTKDKQINKVIEIDVSLIVPNPHQPRTEFDDSDIGPLQNQSVRMAFYSLFLSENQAKNMNLLQVKDVCVLLRCAVCRLFLVLFMI